MRSLFILALVAVSLATRPALADQSFKVDKIEINGVKSVSVDQLRAVLKEKPGDKVTIQDIIADQDLLVKALEKENVTGGVKTSKRDKPGSHIDIIFDVNDNGVQKPVTTTVTRMVNPKLDHLTISGNHLVPADPLLAAANMHAGDDITEQSLRDAIGRIGDAYKARLAKVHKAADITYQTVSTPTSKTTVNIEVRVTEKNVRRGTNDDKSGYGGD